MTITVDQELCQPELQNNATLGDAMAWLQESIALSGKVVVKVEMDGQVLDGEALSSARSWPIRQRVVAFSTADERHLARQMVGKLAALIEFLQGQHGQVASLLEQNNTTTALAMLREVLSAWSQVHSAYCGLVTMLKIDMRKMKVGEFPAAQVMNDFARQLSSLQEALQNQDMVLLADILQYEMDGAIANWVGVLEATLATIEA